ncbi:flagellar basal-body MS-ring/collar protein FliF [Alteraurantiacibacter buctensis]|uniref:Flagellar M-ring protein n=1 Tax=Alteraurantiacibacter buctensis TaxID=1503981 RepID=A0A844YUB9_9SPHN|nr:flagellar basal-body MS-ring/collar protein FliF [Alteraurantiacibacter buctensis]MXO71159.1 flagellar M-ring protein FliF [Alteraurantiacibacter buctensis]
MADAALPATTTPLLPGGGAIPARLNGLMANPAVRRSLPALAGLGMLGVAGALYLSLSNGPERVLYASLTDEERAGVTAALDTGGIAYDIDPASGTLTVAEDDLYRARMLVASDGALASPDSTSEMLDAIPLGSSRTLEGERLKNVRERELMLTIQEIDGVESVRVHLASPERSVFVRENVAPSASVMVRLARGRSLSEDQVRAIVNLVAGSVPGLAPEAVRVVDQSGRLLSASGSSAGDGLELQRQFEDKLRLQVAQLLTPLIGEGNFSTEVQVELNRSEVTSATESYDNEGAIRAESETSSSQGGEQLAGGVPGATTNTPPPPATLEEGAPQGNAANAATTPANGARSTTRTYELGREVAVSSTGPGGVRRLSVAVALSKEALDKIRPATAAQVQQLVSAAVGANTQRGDQVTVVAGAFEAVEDVEVPFYETGWFAMALRYGGGLLALVLALVLGVRPIVNAIRGKQTDAAAEDAGGEGADAAEGEDAFQVPGRPQATVANLTVDNGNDVLREQVDLARRLAAEQPDRAVAALRRMLAAPVEPVA